MSSTGSQRPGADLGVTSSPSPHSEVKNKSARAHPPRLQHSPSLPNIWFPPHSGPIPQQFEVMSREPIRRLSTPPPVENKVVPPLPVKAEKPAAHRESRSFDHAERMQGTKPLKIQMHRRGDREQNQNHSHSLLTPPLTPSSSLKTTVSSDSAANADSGSESHESHGDEADYQSTRFLQLNNVSRQVQHDVLRASIVESLTTQLSRIPPSVPPNGRKFSPLTDDSIKGVYLRSQKSSGTAIMAFFDVRHAEIAKKIISTPTEGPLSHCVGNDVAEDGTRAWITCRFITLEELTKTIGSSSFLTSTDASLYLAVEDTGRDNERELKVADDSSFTSDGIQERRAISQDQYSEGIDPSVGTLKAFLKSFGGLRVFALTQCMDEKKQQPNEKVFHIEYYDVRNAISAYAALDKQNVFGMRLRVFGREDLTESNKPRFQESLHAQGPISTGENFDVPIPATPTDFYGQEPAQFGYPGQLSQMRERFFVEGAQSYVHNSGAQGQETFTISRSPAPSPTYFYTSDPATELPLYNSSNDNLSRSGSENSLYNTPIRTHDRQWLWDASAHSSSTPGPYPHDCYYCPSRGSPTAASPCYAPCSTPSPYCYQQLDQRSSEHPSYTPAVLPINPYAYQYDNSCQPLTPTMAPNTANLAFEHAMMVAPRPQGDLWFSETPGTALQNMLYCGPQASVAGNMQHMVLTKYDSQPSPNPTLEIYRPNLSPIHGSSHIRTARPTLLQGASSGRESRPSAEHNQLNLSRIEDGQDTRTTVMIKNIPNKMSDKDLVAFIAKVCPRRIDFLYLRMDFQNGCNVGYAFVNFITVQDLLCFAKKKLGEKWSVISFFDARAASILKSIV
ncbi:hypothetical protein H0H87_000695 [Tephrocybe sp. NHM501043]|nr:hypothetical protein H0H87_000695 [Tephrocybe sp. NHM501043]